MLMYSSLLTVHVVKSAGTKYEAVPASSDGKNRAGVRAQRQQLILSNEDSASHIHNTHRHQATNEAVLEADHDKPSR